MFEPAPGKLTIDRADPGDRKEIERLIRACGKHVSDYFAMRNTDDYWEAGEVWVAKWGEVHVGFCVVHPLKREPVQSLYQIGVHPEWRGMKIATALIDRALREHPDKPLLRLVVSPENAPGVRMYEAWGLELIEKKPTRRNGDVFVYEGVPKWM